MREALPAREPGAESHPAPSVARAELVRVMVVDDHALVREGTVQLLGQEAGIEVADEAGSGEDALGILRRPGGRPPDVVLVDVNLPGMSGLELAREVRESFPEIQVLVVSAYDDYAYVSEALELGVGGYLLKTASSRELVDAVRAVADGVFVLDRAMSGRLSRRWRSGPPATPPGPGSLTPRETDVLERLARGMSNKHIANELGLGLRTVEGHVSNVLAKLGVASRTEAVLFAISHHLVAAADDGHAPSDG
ncbi:MAG: response regulator transcription factor [Actinomycetota bacterium]|nr:response regulator transcription factor [Actinomycetota bacterium]